MSEHERHNTRTHHQKGKNTGREEKAVKEGGTNEKEKKEKEGRMEKNSLT